MWQSQKNRAVGQIKPRDHILDAIKDDRTGRLDQHLVAVGVELANCKTTATGEPAECIGDPVRYVRQIIEGEQMAVARCNEQITFLARRRPDRGSVGIDQGAKNF